MELAYAKPKCSLHNEALHFWTVFNASVLEYLLFGLIYWWILIKSKDHRKWRSGLAGSCILCSAVVLAALISLMTGWKLPWIRHLLLEVMKKVISRLKEGTNDKPRSCYCSFRYSFHYVAFTLRKPSPLELPLRAVTEYRTKHQTIRRVPSILVLAVGKLLYQQ